MKKNYIYKIFAIAVLTLTMTACSDSFLDEMPDNRTEIDTEEKVEALLVSAYPDRSYASMMELMSDNMDDMGENNPYSERIYDQMYHWQDVTENDNDDPEGVWEQAYNCIASANLAIESAEEIAAEKGWSTGLKQAHAEALLCRAFNHFQLLQIFCMRYNKATADADLGITFMTHSETTLNPKYDRNTIAECVKYIREDIEKALPNIGESYMKSPKYHFNTRAAYAFATRFYLYIEEWKEAKRCAGYVLGANPAAVLRDYQAMSNMTQEFDAIGQHYIDHTLNCNLLLTTAVTAHGILFGPYFYGKRYTHCPYLDNNETLSAKYPWGAINYWMGVKKYSATNLSLNIFWKTVYMFEYTDPVGGYGYYRSVFPEFTCDETLLDRAEAEIMLGEFDAAAEDMTIWHNNISKTQKKITRQMIREFYLNPEVKYSYDDEVGNKFSIGTSTVKKHLSPAFVIGAEGSEQECMLQAILGMKRIQTIHEGKRWFDIKRYGIKIPRRVMNSAGNPAKVVDWLEVEDPRRAVQVPLKVMSAGYTPNPRGNSATTGYTHRFFDTKDKNNTIPMAIQ